MYNQENKYNDSNIVFFSVILLSYSIAIYVRCLLTLLFCASRFSFSSRVGIYTSIEKNTDLRNPHCLPRSDLFSVFVHGQKYKRREAIATREYTWTVYDLTMAGRGNSRSAAQKCALLMFLVVSQVTGRGKSLVYAKLFGDVFGINSYRCDLSEKCISGDIFGTYVALLWNRLCETVEDCYGTIIANTAITSIIHTAIF